MSVRSMQRLGPWMASILWLLFILSSATVATRTRQNPLQRVPSTNTRDQPSLDASDADAGVASLRLEYAFHVPVHTTTNPLTRRSQQQPGKVKLQSLPREKLSPTGQLATAQHTVRRKKQPVAETRTAFGGTTLTQRIGQMNAPNVTDQDTVIALAEMTYDAYIERHAKEWHDVGEDWEADDGFGWNEDGLRGYVFVDKDNSTAVISIKGTSLGVFGIGGGPTMERDKANDNTLLSCCCARVDYSWSTVCGCYMSGNKCNQTCIEESVTPRNIYFDVAYQLFLEINEMYNDPDIWMVGHSLGGSVAGLLGQALGVPTVTFEAPGERLPAQRLHLPMPPAIDYRTQPVWHFGHTADPIFMGTCTGATSACYLAGYAMESKCHTGNTCVYDVVAKWGWGSSVRSHRITDVIDLVIKKWEDGVPECVPEEGCVDCALWVMIDG